MQRFTDGCKQREVLFTLTLEIKKIKTANQMLFLHKIYWRWNFSKALRV